MLYDIILSGKSGCASCHHEGVCAKHAPLQIKSLETPLSLVIQRNKRWCLKDATDMAMLTRIFLQTLYTSSCGLPHHLHAVNCTRILKSMFCFIVSKTSWILALPFHLIPASFSPLYVTLHCLTYTYTHTQESVSAMPSGCRHRHGKLLPPPSCSPHAALPLTWRLEITYGWIHAPTTLSRRWLKNGASY